MQSALQLIYQLLWSPYAILQYLVVKVIIICLFSSILTAILHHFGFTQRLLQLWIEGEASAIANGAPISISRIEIHLIDFFTLKSTIRLYDAVIHTPNAAAASTCTNGGGGSTRTRTCEWRWESPLIARIGYAEATFNPWSCIDLPIWFKERIGIQMDVVKDLYSVELHDVQVFVEKRRNVFNFHLLDERLDLPEAKDVIESMNFSDGNGNAIGNGPAMNPNSHDVNVNDNGGGTTEKDAAANNALHVNKDSNDASGAAADTMNGDATNATDMKGLETKDGHQMVTSTKNSSNTNDIDHTTTTNSNTKRNKTKETSKNVAITTASSTSTSISSSSSNIALNHLDNDNDNHCTEQVLNHQPQEDGGESGNGNDNDNDNDKNNEIGQEIEDEGAKKAKELVMQIVGAVSTLGRAANEGGTQALSDELRNQKDGFVSHLKNVQAMVGLSIDETRKTKNTSKNSTTTSIDIAKEGIQVIKQVGKVVEKNVLNMKEQVDALSKPPPFRKDWVPLANPPLFRVGVIAIRDVRIFTKDIIVVAAGAQIQKQMQMQNHHSTSNNNGVGSIDSINHKNVRFENHANMSTSATGWSKPILVEKVNLYPSELCPPRHQHSKNDIGHEGTVDDETMLSLVAQPIENISNLVLERILTEMAKSTTGQLLSNAFVDVFALFDITGMSGNNAVSGGGSVGNITRSSTRDTIDF